MKWREKRQSPRTPELEPELLDQGISQLTHEIQTLTEWIVGIGVDQVETRKAYEDMLRSRSDMLLALQQQKLAQKNQQNSANS